LFLPLALTFAGCAITFDPKPIDIVPFKERAQTQAQDDLTVTVAVPTLEEAKAIYGVDLSWKGMQPVWVEVKNEGNFPSGCSLRGSTPRTFLHRRLPIPFVKRYQRTKADILKLANDKDLGRMRFVEETASGRISWKSRKIADVLENVCAGDNIIVSEFSRLGRSMLECMEILSIALDRKFNIYAVKGN
jgi:hypothetical protein